MEALLIESLLDEASLSVVREHIRTLEVSADVRDRAFIVATELGRNQLKYGRGGRMGIRAIDRGAFRGIEIDAIDAGPGITDVAAALDAMPRTQGSLGIGIGAVRRMSSELDIDVRLDEGTRIVARILHPDASRAREVGIYGRPIESEQVSGDHAAFHRLDDALVVGVCDGLGHGPAARIAADAAIAVLAEHPDAAPSAVIEECHRRILGTRGVVMSVARIASTLELASLGNVEAQITAVRTSRRFGGSAGVVGGSPGPIRVRTETTALASEEVFLLMTDGIVSRASIESDLLLLRAHPAVIAQRVLERFARPGDDALVLVVR